MIVQSFKAKLRDNRYFLLFLLMIIFSTISMTLVYFTEYVLGYKPCPLCIYQRIPYFIIFFSSILSIIYNRIYKVGLLILIVSVISSIMISGYHSGVERDIFKPLDVCSTNNNMSSNISLAEYLEIINQAQAVPCTIPAFTIFGLSMADYNLIINIFMIYILLNIIFYHRVNYAKT